MPAKRSKSLSRTLVFAWVTLVLSVIAGLGWTNLSLARQFKNSFRWVSHTQDVLNRIEETISLLKDVEAGQRGFVLSGDVAHLEIYHHARATIPGNIADLIDLTEDDPKQHTRVLELRDRIQQRISLAEESVAARTRGDVDIAAAVTRTGRGKASMDSVRAVGDDLKREEKRHLIERQIAANNSLYYQQIFRIALITLLIISAAGIFWLRRRLTAVEQELIRVCAWTNQVEHNGQWMTVDRFLLQRFGLKTSHGMSEQAAKQFHKEMHAPGTDSTPEIN